MLVNQNIISISYIYLYSILLSGLYRYNNKDKILLYAFVMCKSVL